MPPWSPSRMSELLLNVPIERVAHHSTDDAGGREDEAVLIGHNVRARIHRDDQRVIVLVLLDLVKIHLASGWISTGVRFLEQLIQGRVAEVVVVVATLILV